MNKGEADEERRSIEIHFTGERMNHRKDELRIWKIRDWFPTFLTCRFEFHFFSLLFSCCFFSVPSKIGFYIGTDISYVWTNRYIYRRIRLQWQPISGLQIYDFWKIVVKFWPWFYWFDWVRSLQQKIYWWYDVKKFWCKLLGIL